MIAAGGYYVAVVDDGSPTAFGLGAADSARLYAPGDLVNPLDSYSWTAHAATTYGRCPNGTGAFTTTTSATRGAVNDCSVPGTNVKINEIESDDATVPDYVELINNGVTAADIGGYVVKDNVDADNDTIPAGTMIAAGGYYVVDTNAGSPTPFGLGSSRLGAPVRARRPRQPGRLLHLDGARDHDLRPLPERHRCVHDDPGAHARRGEPLSRRRRRPALAGRHRRRHRRRAQRVRRRTSAAWPTSPPAPRRPACCGRCATARARCTA